MQNQSLIFKHIQSANQIADILTKVISSSRFQELRSKLRVVPNPTLLLRGTVKEQVIQLLKLVTSVLSVFPICLSVGVLHLHAREVVSSLACALIAVVTETGFVLHSSVDFLDVYLNSLYSQSFVKNKILLLCFLLLSLNSSSFIFLRNLNRQASGIIESITKWPSHRSPLLQHSTTLTMNQPPAHHAQIDQKQEPNQKESSGSGDPKSITTVPEPPQQR